VTLCESEIYLKLELDILNICTHQYPGATKRMKPKANRIVYMKGAKLMLTHANFQSHVLIKGFHHIWDNVPHMMYIQIHIPHTYVCSMFPFRIFRRVRLEQSLDLMQGGLFVYIEASLDGIAFIGHVHIHLLWYVVTLSWEPRYHKILKQLRFICS
jgi:hypothetical protein